MTHMYPPYLYVCSQLLLTMQEQYTHDFFFDYACTIIGFTSCPWQCVNSFHTLYSKLRSSPTYQFLVGLSLSQGLTHLLLMLCYELSQLPWLCYTLGLLFHYFILVTLSWAAVLPVVGVVKVFKRLWHEKAWLIAPFAAVISGKTSTQQCY